MVAIQLLHGYLAPTLAHNNKHVSKRMPIASNISLKNIYLVLKIKRQNLYSYQAYKHHKKTKYADQHITGNLMPAAAVLTQRWYRLTSRAQLSCPPPHTHQLIRAVGHHSDPESSPGLGIEPGNKRHNQHGYVQYEAHIHITTFTFDAGYLCKIQANSNPEMTCWHSYDHKWAVQLQDV